MLARELGYTLNDLLASLGEGELALWIEHHKLHPLGDPWRQTGLVCATVANFNPWGSKRVFREDEFMPLHREPPTPGECYKMFRAMITAVGVPVIDRTCSDSPLASTTSS